MAAPLLSKLPGPADPARGGYTRRITCGSLLANNAAAQVSVQTALPTSTAHQPRPAQRPPTSMSCGEAGCTVEAIHSLRQGSIWKCG